jgi:hypothetical protein
MSGFGMIGRRTVLRGLGTTLALPLLEAMVPRTALGASVVEKGQKPLRMAFVYVPNGVHMQDWTPAEEGTSYQITKTLEPLAKFKSEFNVLTGLTHRKAFANGDGGGDHARALATFLTGCQAKKTHGADIRAGVSIDQLVAQQIGKATKFASLELGIDPSAQAGNCDSGYSCAYSSNISWKTENQPLSKEVNPRLAFDRLFSNGEPGETAEARAKRLRYHKSILDLVHGDAKKLTARLGSTDRRKMDEYLTAVRELEQRIARSDKSESQVDGLLARPAGIPETNADHIDLMLEILALAFQTDTSRVATFVMANEGSNKSYPFLEVPEGHHDLSHHGKDEGKWAKIKKINHYHVTRFARLIEKLQGMKEGDGTVLDNSLIVYGSGIGDGDRHNHDDLPILLAGKAGGQLQTGRHVKFENDTPLANLYLTMGDLLGAKVEHLGDSTGKLKLV